ncbi:MAG: phosphatase PAP2 family protein [Dehalococcoidia bacterium]
MARQSIPLRRTVERFRLVRLPSLPVPERWRRLMQRYAGMQDQHGRLVLAMQFVYLALFLAVFFLGSNQWPAAPDLITVGLFGFAIVTARALRFLRDWTPFLLLTIGYLALPGLTPGLQQRAHVGFPITVDRWLGRGELPTTRLQAWLWDGGRLHWWDYAASTLYLLHFVVPLVLAYLFWHWRRPLYLRFVRTYLVLMYAGFTLYLLYPMAPPWWASDLGRVPHVAPVLSLVKWKGIGNPVGILTGAFQPDPVAAMPSIHAAFSMLVFLVLWQTWPRRAWVAVAYPLAMATTVLYTGDHYVIDILMGWLFAVVAFRLIWWRSRPQALTTEAGSSPQQLRTRYHQ